MFGCEKIKIIKLSKQMSYINKSLSKNEEVSELYKLHWFSKVGLWVLSAFSIILTIPIFFAVQEGKDEAIGISLIAFVVFFIPAVYEWLRLRSIEYGVTNKRVISKSGIISIKTEEMKIGSIETVEIDQGVLGRIFGFGSIKITGRGISDLVYENIDSPMKVKKSIESIEHIQNISI